MFGLVMLMSVFGLFLGSLLRAMLVFWPVMLFLGVLHTSLPVIPALGWFDTFILIAVITLLFGGYSGSSSTKNDD